MANYQNNMRYGRQMNFNNGCRPMPVNNNNCRPEPVQAPCGEQQRRASESCEGRVPEREMPKNKKPEQCECRYDVLEDLPIAMAYVPWQKWRNLCKPCNALRMGTIFEDLYKPFYGRGGCNR